ncbi:hypothetical protein M947_09945 [Sulfurimonas hongkongensis]|uniref:Uncharacterized protein n=1 Tax=Sulfurimonas hongkongensis TaxID=1172190 RepID=T0KFR2_9BACT|nr:hypothetical protein [Sulfurimonas hongkongensis]EQB35594.1 hypothetical protein M947_09945 [Sulfurimonas hongkongensis]
MAVKNYKNIYTELNKSKFLKLQIIVLFFTTYIDWIIMPYITKLEAYTCLYDKLLYASWCN